MTERAAAGIGEAWRAASRRIDRLDARLLVEHVVGCTHADLIARPETPLSAEQSAALDALVARRTAGEPLAYLTGSAMFHDFEFHVSPAVLIPRPETELLVELGAKFATERARTCPAPRIVDLGTGSGIVAITLARLCPQAAVSAVDVSPEALAVAAANAARLAPAVRLLAGDWYAPLSGERFDLIVSNPPYVVSGDPHLALNGLPFEPQGALTDGVAGGDGLACIRAIVSGAPMHLAAGGWLLIEHGYDQAAGVQTLLRAENFSEVQSWQDLAGIDRVSGGRRI
ncbi:MAG: protein-(glutamine-N5) methyltransferase, release factor-specific [Candidatus Accumulibacter sp. 66-26]|nr:MAG: protein-(glutamine-N5) methyltransferase, release factor-specific [Candidatus Accumulibacter sp. 66-26]